MNNEVIVELYTKEGELKQKERFNRTDAANIALLYGRKWEMQKRGNYFITIL